MASQRTVLFCATAAVAGLALVSTSCRGNRQAQGAPAAPPPSAVQVLTLQNAPIEDSSDFIATIKSLRSSRIQPEVEGTITRIYVQAGQQVSAGAPLVQINPERQTAAVQATEANLPGAEADVKYWQAQVTRLEALVAAGAISRAEFDQAQNSLRSAEARLAATIGQIKENRVQLDFTRVEAPHAGIVGDITVRVGDRVSNSTVITTIDDKEALEANVQVPIDRSPQLRLGLSMRLLDSDGNTVATNPVTFVAPRVDDATQTVLIKALLREAPPAVRVLQFVRSRLVWREVEGIKAPVTAVTRISGQYFCFVAEKGPQGGLVARQKPIDVGQVVGNDYVIRKGLQAGEQLIVSGIQKIGDGAPVQVQAAEPAAPAAPAQPAK